MNADAQLVQRAARRDERAFAAIYRRYHQEIYRFCLALLGNREDAHDALQNTMVKALQALPGEKRSIQLRPWLYQVAHNESIEIVRGRGKTAPIDPELADPAAGLAETAAERERLRQLLRDLADLPKRQRAALLLRELGGLEFAQIGEFFGGSEAVARQAVYEARVSLRSLEAGREMSCEEVMHRLSNADGRVRRRRDLRAHLRDCPDCRAFRDAIESRRRDFAAIAPLPALASVGILHAALASAPSVAGGTASGVTAAAGAGKALSAGLLAKSVATVAVVTAIGVTAADRGGLIHTGLPAESGTDAPAGQVESSDGAGAAEPASGNSSSSEGSAQGHESGKSKGASQAHGNGGRQADRQNGASTSGSASRHGRETAAAHGHGASAAQSHANGASHRQSHHSSHGHGRTHAKPKHAPAPHPVPAPSKPKQEGSAQQSAEEISPSTEQSSGSGTEKAGSGVGSKDMP
jgi:RNA polymerase sigma factor (sigma-70 family)